MIYDSVTLTTPAVHYAGVEFFLWI